MYSCDQRKIYEIYNYPDIWVFMKNAGKTELKVSMTFAQNETLKWIFFLYQVYLEFDWQVCPLLYNILCSLNAFLLKYMLEIV